MQTVIIVLHLMIVATLIATVLLQKSEGGALGMGGGGGGGGGFMSSRGTANLLTRTTAVLAVGFFITSLLLSWIASYDRKPTTVIDTPATQSQPAPPVSQGGGVLDTLKQQDQRDNQQAPSAPQPPRSQ
ncbi:preprotein translocase subunit SecG [Rhodopseudomonas palustris]|uniref:Protein-export membrane protein SecG n=1 Tax=Rhodopseudomonas palustris (strain BisB18) TaxID=316056 RepID=Q215B3_RHOPB